MPSDPGLHDYFDGMEVADWGPMYRRSVKALVAFRLPNGIRFNDCAYCARGEWRLVYPPQKVTPKANGYLYKHLVDFESAEVEDAFQRATLAAIDRYLSRNRETASADRRL